MMVFHYRDAANRDLQYYHQRLVELVREAEGSGMKFWIDNGVYEFLITDSAEAQRARDYDRSMVVW